MSKVLKYTTKDDEGRTAVLTYYPSEIELAQVRELLLSSNRPKQIEFRGNVLTTKNLEILDERQEEAGGGRYHLNPSDPKDKEVIRTFEREYTEWCDQHPEIRTRKFEAYLAERGAIRIDKDGYEIVLRPALYTELHRKYSGLNLLNHYRKQAAKKESEAVDSLTKERRELIGAVAMPKADEDEIRLEDIPF